MSWSFILLSPAPGYLQLPFRDPLSRPKKQKGMRRRGRGCGFNHKLSRQLSPSSLTPQTSRAPHRGRLPLRQKTPAARPPRAPAALSASRAADPKLALPAFAQVIRKAPAAPRRPPTSGPTPPPQTELTCLHGPVGAPESREARLSFRGGAPIPRGTDSRGWRRRGEGKEPAEAKGREGSAAFRAQESARGARSGKGEPPKPEAVPPAAGSEGRGREAGEDCSSGRGRTASGHLVPAARRGPEPGGQAAEEQERSNLPAACARSGAKVGKNF